MTYLAGCTDPDYEDGACPGKGAFAGESLPSSIAVVAHEIQIKLGLASSIAMALRINGWLVKNLAAPQ